MRTLWNEYGGVVLGVVGAAAVTAMTANLLLPKGNIYELLLMFSQTIC